MAIMTTPKITPMLSGEAMAIGRALTPELGGLAMAYGRATTQAQRSHIILDVAKKLQQSSTATQEVKKLTNRDVKTACSMFDGKYAMNPIDQTIWSAETLETMAVKQAAPAIEKVAERTFIAEILEFIGAAALAFASLPAAMQVGIIVVVVIVVICVANGFFHFW